MSWTRRLFIREALKGWLGLVVGPAAYFGIRSSVNSSSGLSASPRDVGSADALHPGMSKIVQLGGSRVLIVKDRQGELRAVNAICTHLGCSVRFEPARGSGEIACNCHESRFTLSGENLSGPATRPLVAYRIENEGGRLVLSRKAAATGER